jgi:RNA polymerase sigma-70 factor (ECF subfamily)
VVGGQVAEEERAGMRAVAFRELAHEHLDASYRLASVILGNPVDAQDATHDAFVQAWRRWSTLRDPAKFGPWFDRILVNTCRDRLRRTSRWRTEDLSPDLAAAVGDATNQVIDRDVLGEALAALSPDHRVVVVLRFYRDLTAEDIARLLAIPAGTVHSRLHHALKRLRAALDDADAGVPPDD